jgi:hypothetical protein
MNKKAIATALRALAKSVETLENAPAYVVPAFDPSAESPLEYATRIQKEAKEHGDTDTANRNAMYKTLSDGFLAIVKEHNLSKVKATGDGMRKPSVSLNDAQKEEVRARRTKGEQITTLADAFNVSYATVYKLCEDIKPAKGQLVAE